MISKSGENKLRITKLLNIFTFIVYLLQDGKYTKKNVQDHFLKQFSGWV